MVRRLGLPALVVFLAACSLPPRDNPVDPSNAPHVSLAVVSLPEGAACAGTAGWSSIASASPGRCLALDARATYDPRGRVIARFEYAFLDTDLVLKPVPYLVEATSGLAILDPGWLRQRPANVLQEFEATAYDDAGAWSVAQAAVLLENTRPVAVGDGPRILPLGGYPWAPSPTFDVTFDGSSSYDPDGDDLVKLCWTFPSGETCAVPPATSIHVTISSATPSRLAGVLRAWDVHGPSLPVPVSVDVSDPVVWSHDESFGARIVRFDSRFRTYVPGAGSWIVGDLSGGTFRRFAFAQQATTGGGNPTSVMLLGTNGAFTTYSTGELQAPTAVVDGSTMWLATFSTGGVGQPRSLQQWDLSADAKSLTKSATVTLATGLVPTGLEVDGAHRVWIAYGATNGVAVVDGGVSQRAIGPGPLFTGKLAARPGTEEVWALDSPPGYLGGPQSLVVYDDPQSVPQRYALPDSISTTLAWTGPDDLWIARHGDGVREIDVPRFLQDGGMTPQARLDDATLLEVPLLRFVSRLIPDRATDEIWGQASNGLCFRVDSLGSLVDGIQCEVGVFESRDDEGTFVFDRFQQPHLAGTPSSDGIAATSPLLGGAGTGLVDESDGDVWKYVSDFPALVDFAPDGTIRRMIQQVVIGGQIVPLPPFYTSGYTVDADGSHVWLEELDGSSQYAGIRRYDLSQDPPVADPPGLLLPAPQTTQPQLGPSLTGMDSIWLREQVFNTEDDYGLLSVDGIWSLRLSNPANFNGVYWARSLRTNALCVGYETGAPGTATMHRLDPAGGAANLGSVAVFNIQGVEAIDDPAGDVCALVSATTTPASCPAIGTTVVTGWNPSGTIVLNQSFSQSVPLSADALHGDSLADWWVQVTACVPSQHIEAMHVTPGHVEHVTTTGVIGFARR